MTSEEELRYEEEANEEALREIAKDFKCIHAQSGLCEKCMENFLEDPSSWIEFGDHPEGLKRFKEFLEEMEEWDRNRPPQDYPNDSEIPF